MTKKVFDDQKDIDELNTKLLALTSNEPKVRDPGSEIIFQKMKSDPLQFARICGGVLNQANLPSSSHTQALNCIDHIITPDNDVKIEFIRGKWMSFDKEKRDFIKSSILCVLTLPDKNVANEASQTLKLYPLIEQLLAIIQSSEYNDDIHLSCINTLNKICSEGILDDMIQTDEVKEVLSKIFDSIGKLFVNKNNPENIQISICNVLNTLISISAPLFYPPQVFNQFVTLVTNHLADNPPQLLHQHLIQLLTSLTLKFYESDGFNFNGIGSIVLKYLFDEKTPEKSLTFSTFGSNSRNLKKNAQEIQFKQRYENLVEERHSSIKTRLPPHIKSTTLTGDLIQSNAR